jgi:hypothetical protein
MATRKTHGLLATACVCALGALALMTWQLFDPRVFPVIIAMSVGQLLGTASFVAFGYVVLMDVRERLKAARDASARSYTSHPPA